MKVALTSYPFAFQVKAGLAIQILETMSALEELGIDAQLFDMRYDNLSDFDLVHVFAAIHGNHKIVEGARYFGVPVVLSPILHPPFSRWQSLNARLCERLTGRLTDWAINTSYGQIRSGLDTANRIVVLGLAEMRIVTSRYNIPKGKVRLIPNGIPKRFFSSCPDDFVEKYRIDRGFVLCPAYISGYKNQLGLIRALSDDTRRIVLVGDCKPIDRPYLNECLSLGGNRVRYLGALDHDDPMLASVYAAAGVVVLASKTEVAPLGILESLAAGTPAIVTRNNSLDLEPDGRLLAFVDPDDSAQIHENVHRILDRPPTPSDCRTLVESLTWTSVATKLQVVYAEAIADKSE